MYDLNIIFEKTTHRIDGEFLIIDNVKTCAGRVDTGHHQVTINTAVMAEAGTDMERLTRTLERGSVFGFSVDALENNDGSLDVVKLERLLPHGVVPGCQTIERTEEHGGFIIRTTPGPGLDTNAHIYDDGEWINIVTDAHEGSVYFEETCLDAVIDALTALRDARRAA